MVDGTNQVQVINLLLPVAVAVVVITIIMRSPTTRSALHTVVSLQVVVSLILIITVEGRETVLPV